MGWTGGYQWLLLSAGRPEWQTGLEFQCRDRSREVGESRRRLLGCPRKLVNGL